jgi:capsid protein
MKQKIAACLAVITSDVDGTAAPLGTVDGTDTVDSLEPGMIMNVAPGRTVEVVQPPSVREYADYTKTTLRGMATGLRVTYEDLTGDYAEVNFSSSRMSRLRHWASVDDWRWRMLIPQFCDPVWGWAMQAAAIGVNGQPGIASFPMATWTAPPIPMIEPDKEGLAYQRNIRTGIMSLPDAIRERGYDPDELFAEVAATNEKLDRLGLVFDCDPRRMTQQGLMQTPPTEDAPQAGMAEDEGDDRARRLRLAGTRR